MTTLSIALDGPRQRDITLYSGDDVSIDVVVYAKDGDRTPLTTVTDVAVTYSPGYAGANGLDTTGFTADFYYRTHYTMTANVAGKRTTLAHGLLISPDYFETTIGFCDYGWWTWGVQPPIVTGCEIDPPIFGASFLAADVGKSVSRRTNSDGTINEADMNGFDADGMPAVGSAVIGVKINGVSIVGSMPPTLSGASASINTALTGWSKTYTKGDLLTYTLVSVSGLASVLLALQSA